ncbi:MAG: DUF167 domain-containing protein [Phycisphaeraceae bacterium]|nr:DUF167 domain-containing protein [Phycisphaeraceae bacterium]
MLPGNPPASWPPLTADPAGPLLRVKVVPGASRSRVAGLLGDRLKIQVAAPPEGGKANKAVCELIADLLGVPSRQITVEAGHTQPAKTLRLTGVDHDRAVELLQAAASRHRA